MLRPAMLAVALVASACDSEPQGGNSPAPTAVEALLPPENRQSRLPPVLPMPKDQTELDRLILAGYTPHSDHLHPPGVKSCPLIKGDDAVM